MSGWVQLADITLNSGRRSSFKIECDDLTDAEVAAMCALLVKVLPAFGAVSGVPTGGLRLEEAMRPHVTVTCGRLLIIDDVWTTGGSMKRHWMDLGSPAWVVGAVLFARGDCPSDIKALFTIDKGLWSA
jgi:orotate phosphoribosyltransferase